jgi:hypothetical protein
VQVTIRLLEVAGGRSLVFTERGSSENLIDAEIFLDEEFVGYTTGDGRVPFVIENIAPGKHRLRIHLADFGVVKEPEISDILYDLQKLLGEEIDFSELQRQGHVERRHELSFTDRQGRRIAIRLLIDTRLEDQTLEAQVTLSYAGKDYPLSLSAPVTEDREVRSQVELVEVELEADSGDLSYQIWRTDIQQNTFR